MESDSDLNVFKWYFICMGVVVIGLVFSAYFEHLEKAQYIEHGYQQDDSGKWVKP